MRTINLQLFLFIFLISFGCRSQITVYNIDTPPESRTVTNNFYYKDIDNHNDAIVGVWLSENSNKTFKLTLKEFEMYSDPLSPNIYCDEIYGKYTYTVNGQTVVDIKDIGTWLEFMVSFNFSTPSLYKVVIRDPVSQTGKIGEFILTSPTTAEMRLWNSEGIKVNYGNGQPWALPTYFEFTKQ